MLDAYEIMDDFILRYIKNGIITIGDAFIMTNEITF